MAVVSINYPSIADCEAAPGAAGFDVGSTAIIGTSNFTLEVSSASINHTTVLDAKIGGVRWLISANPASAITSLTGPITGTGPGAAATTMAVNAVATTNITDLNVTTGKLADAAVTFPKMSNTGATAVIAGSAAQDLAVTGLSGNTDGDYIVEGILIGALASTTVTLQLNGAALQTCHGTSTIYTVSVSGPTFSADTTAPIAVCPGGSPATIAFAGRVSVKSGVIGVYQFQSTGYDGTLTFATVNSVGFHTPSANVTSVSVHSSSATGLGVGSFIRVQKTGFSI